MDSARRWRAASCCCRDSASLLDRGLWRLPAGALAMSFAPLGEHLAIALPGGTALFTTRRGGVSEGPFASLNLGLWTDDAPGRVHENRARVQRLAGGRLAQARQVHGTTVADADPGAVPDADGQVTAHPGVAAMALVADCLPIALVAP